MNQNIVLGSDLFVDNNNTIRIIDPQLADKTSQLRTECIEFSESKY